jgi:hypothetical protein
MQFKYPKAFIKNAQDTGEALNPQKGTSSTSTHDISFPFRPSWIRIWIQQFKLIDGDPDPKPWFISEAFL